MDGKHVSLFTRFARKTSSFAGRPITFIAAIALLLTWAITGPIFGFSDTWQLIINTGTTIVTFLMVFVIQNTQNRDTEALQIKLDEIIRSRKSARNQLLDLEELDEQELDRSREEYLELAATARNKLDEKKKMAKRAE